MPHSQRDGLSRRKLLQFASVAGLGIAAPALSRNALGQAASPLKIGIIGSGNIGSTIGTLWVKAGHPVMFSSRHPEELAPLVQGLGALAKSGAVADAIKFGDVVFIAVPYGAYPQIGKDYGSLLSGKILLDAGNATVRRDGEDITNEAKEEGIGVITAKYLPGARVVRAFNSMGYKFFASEANRPGERMAIPLAGDDKDALTTASLLVHDAGFDPVIVGSLVQSKTFQQGGPLYGQQLTEQEFRKRLEAVK